MTINAFLYRYQAVPTSSPLTVRLSRRSGLQLSLQLHQCWNPLRCHISWLHIVYINSICIHVYNHVPCLSPIMLSQQVLPTCFTACLSSPPCLPCLPMLSNIPCLPSIPCFPSLICPLTVPSNLPYIPCLPIFSLISLVSHPRLGVGEMRD